MGSGRMSRMLAFCGAASRGGAAAAALGSQRETPKWFPSQALPSFGTELRRVRGVFENGLPPHLPFAGEGGAFEPCGRTRRSSPETSRHATGDTHDTLPSTLRGARPATESWAAEPPSSGRGRGG